MRDDRQGPRGEGSLEPEVDKFWGAGGTRHSRSLRLTFWSERSRRAEQRDVEGVGGKIPSQPEHCSLQERRDFLAAFHFTVLVRKVPDAMGTFAATSARMDLRRQ